MAKRKSPARTRTRPSRRRAGTGIDPEGHFVARVRGEEAAREAPHPMTESDEAGGGRVAGGDDEGPGELPATYGGDSFVLLPRDPTTLFACWDLARATVAKGLAGAKRPRAQLWVFAEREGGRWDRVRVVDLALESRCSYVHDLEPGRTYRAEIHAASGGGDRLVGAPSGEVRLPPAGPSPVVEDRFARIPWDLPLDRWSGEGA